MSVQRSHDTAVLRLAGEADVSGLPRLQVRLNDLLAPGRSPQVRALVVDASELTFLDLAGLDALLKAAEQLRGRGGSLVLRSPGRRVRRLLEVLDVGDALGVQP
jgi:anti-anti-sigma factor